MTRLSVYLTLASTAAWASGCGPAEGPRVGVGAPPGAGVARPASTTRPAPKPLPRQATVALADLTPAIARPADPPGAEKVPDRAAEALADARKLIAAKDFVKATELLERARGFAPNSGPVLRELGLAYAALPDLAKAEPPLRKAADLAPDHVEVQFLLAQYDARQRQPAKAVIRLRTALLCSDATDDNPVTAEALLLLGTMLEQAGYWTASLECFDRLGDLISRHGRTLMQRPLLKLAVSRPEANLVTRGFLLLELRRPGDAAKLLENAYRRDKTNFRAGALAVRALAGAGQFDPARRIVLEMLADPALHDQAVASAGELCRAAKDPALPRGLLEAHLAENQKDPMLAVAMAEAASELGAADEAAAILAKHLPARPADARQARRLVRLFVRTGNLDRAAEQAAAGLTADWADVQETRRDAELLAAHAADAKNVDAIVARAHAAEDPDRPALLTVAAVLADTIGLPARAAALLEDALKADPKFWPAYDALAGIHAEQDNQDALDALTQRARKADEEGHFHFYLAGRSSLERLEGLAERHMPTADLLDQAAASLQQALLRRGRDVPTLALLARVEWLRAFARNLELPQRIERLRSAEKHLLAALGLAPGNAQVAGELVELFMVRGRNTEAGMVASSFLAGSPGTVEARVLAARYYLRTDELDQAMEAVEPLLERLPLPSAGDNGVLIAVLLHKKLYDQALNVADAWRAVAAVRAKRAGEKSRADNQLLDAQTQTVHVLLEAERPADALARARAFSNARPKNVRMLSLLAAVLKRMDKDDEGRAVLERLFALDPENPGTNNDLGYTWADMGVRLEEAEAMIRKAVEARPDVAAFRDSLGWVLYKKGRFAEAKKEFDAALKAPADELHPVILDHAGDTCWRLGLKQEAIDHWKRAVEMATEAKRKDRETRAVLAETPAKIAAGSGGDTQPKTAPLGKGVTPPPEKK